MNTNENYMENSTSINENISCNLQESKEKLKLNE